MGKYFIPYGAVVENTTYYASMETWEEMNDEQRAAVQAAFVAAAAALSHQGPARAEPPVID